MKQKKPKQTIVPKNVVEAYNMFTAAKKEGKIAIIYGGRRYGQTILSKLLSNEN
jgi:hypothetical protein